MSQRGSATVIADPSARSVRFRWFEVFGGLVSFGQSESDKRTNRSEEPDVAGLFVGTHDIPGGSFGEARRDDLADRRIRVSRLATGDQILASHMHSPRVGTTGGGQV